MMRHLMILFFTCACIYTQAQVKIITTICGTDTAGYNGDDKSAQKSELNVSVGLCLDISGNIYIADAENNRVRKINISTGIITTIAGTGEEGFSGDGGQATNATLGVPSGVFTDTAGNVYIADEVNNRIRKVIVSTGIITTVAGSGAIGVSLGGFSGDNGPATNATMNLPVGLCLDKAANIYITDYENNRIRKVDASTGIISTVAGIGTAGYLGGFVGYSGDGGLAINAQFSGTYQVFADSTGNLFICDQWNHAIRKVNASTGIITTIAGTGTAGYTGDGGLATKAQLNQPCGVYVDKQENVFIAEYGDGVIRRIDGITGIISTVAGTGTLGFSGDGGPATNAKLRCGDVFLDQYGHVFIADEDNNRIREVFDSATVSVPILTSAPKIEVYPNPANEELNITGIKQNTTFRLQNVTGICVLQGAFEKGDNKLLMRNLMPGIYILEMTGIDGQRNITRVVKE
jgi:hypothetical protein